jgi:hypothetical protein
MLLYIASKYREDDSSGAPVPYCEEDGLSEIERLDTLAARINAEHRACETAVNAALEHALTAGDLLLEAKSKCPHGTWQGWLEENFEGSVRTAQAYMRVAARRDEVEAAKTQSSAPLSLDGALKALSAPKEETQPSLAELEAKAEAARGRSTAPMRPPKPYLKLRASTPTGLLVQSRCLHAPTMKSISETFSAMRGRKPFRNIR